MESVTLHFNRDVTLFTETGLSGSSPVDHHSLLGFKDFATRVALDIL